MGRPIDDEGFTETEARTEVYTQRVLREQTSVLVEERARDRSLIGGVTERQGSHREAT